jgi:CHAT domain-containing protein/Tfp pilus assembly protein PilF
VAATLHNLGNVAWERGDLDGAQRYYQQALAIQERLAPNSLQVAATLNNLGAVALGRGDLDGAQRYYQQALAIRERLAPNSLEVARTLIGLGNVALDRGDLDGAQRYYQQALALTERLAPNSLQVASTLNNLGLVAANRGDLDGAQRYYQQALALQERLAPNSLQVAGTLNNLGNVAYSRGDLDGAQRYLEQALAIKERLAPNSLDVAITLNNLGNVARSRGDLDGAQRYYQQALAIKERLAPNSLDVAITLNNLGNVALDRGDLDGAQRYYQQALAIRERLAPNSLDVAGTLNNLGNVASDRGDLDGAQRYYQQALDIFNRLAPNSLEVAATLIGLGNVAERRGDLDGAQRYFEQALAIRERLAPNSLDVAITLHNLGLVAYRRGDLDGAQRYYQQALEIKERLTPNSLQVAATLHNLGNVALDRGDLDGAQRYYQQALDIFNRLAPNSLQVAGTLSNLARLALARNHPQQAIPRLRDALTITEAQRQAVSDPETRALFAERYYDAYPLLARAYLQLNQPAQAAETLERSRARSLAETLQLRQLARAPNTPQALKQLLSEYEQLHAQRLRLAQQADANDRLQQYRALDQQQRALDQRLRKEFPDYANLIIPQPLSLPQIQQSLDAGTVLLYHALLEDHLLIVAVSRTQVRGFVQKVDGRQLARQVERFREVVGKPPVFRTAPERRDVAQLGQALYKHLIAPAQGVLQNAQRVLLCPDGVLSQLPWAALVVQVNNGKPVYWLERVALHFTPSVGVYRQARGVQPVQQGAAVVAVWNYTNGKPIDLAQRPRSEVAMLLRRSGAGTALTDLDYVSEEVKALRRALGKGVRALENAQATPQRARQAAQGARVVHFACHAWADNVEPLRSALSLAPAGSDAGLLTAGEVLLNWRLRADMVMLSACETGLGLARRYEGVYSLGRAFLVAGSRSVGASLWQVDDKSTAELMAGFYGRYARGVAKDVALREAQLALLRDGKYADPYYWAGFVLMGDCK